MSEIKIDKNVPIPRRQSHASNNCKYPWHEMDIGDSFYLEVAITQAGSRFAYANRKWPDRKWIARKEGTGSRVWRVK